MIVIYLGLILLLSSSELLLIHPKMNFALASDRVYHPDRFPCGKRILRPSLLTFTPL